jgi:hypothetical protein
VVAGCWGTSRIDEVVFAVQLAAWRDRAQERGYFACLFKHNRTVLRRTLLFA